jgi:hypothetical protein
VKYSKEANNHLIYSYNPSKLALAAINHFLHVGISSKTMILQRKSDTTIQAKLFPSKRRKILMGFHPRHANRNGYLTIGGYEL